MFKKPGKTLKTMAVTLFWIGVALAVIFMIPVMDEDVSFFVVPMIFLCFWIVSIFTYAFGDLLEKVTQIANEVKKPIVHITDSKTFKEYADNNKAKAQTK